MNLLAKLKAGMQTVMKHHIQTSADAAAKMAAQLIADLLANAIAIKPVASVAFSGGNTPNRMFQYLVRQKIDWTRVEIFQVDERFAAAGDPARNLTTLQQHLLNHIDIPQQQVHAMPVEAPDPERSLLNYTYQLETITGNPPQLDIIHLGLGDDGHTASLPPGYEVLNSNRPVDICADYNGYQRMTLTYPVLNQAGSIIWLVIGAGKKTMLGHLLAGDTRIPAGRVGQKRAILVADDSALAQKR